MSDIQKMIEQVTDNLEAHEINVRINNDCSRKEMATYIVNSITQQIKEKIEEVYDDYESKEIDVNDAIFLLKPDILKLFEDKE